MPFVAAGAPHFLAVFGRDALLVSLLTMLSSETAPLDTLEVLAAHQGSRHDPVTLEEPGRILHELRIGEMGVFGIEAGAPYYGSVDATPLFVVVLAECLRWGHDPDRVAALLPAARAAVEWCRRHVDRRGFVHSVPHDRGIRNQGWKDSDVAIVRPDGSAVDGTTSLVEVQGYVHEALLGLAELEELLGDPSVAPRLRSEAAAHRDRFERHFVVGGRSVVVLALDESGEQLDVRASNVGHLLATSAHRRRRRRGPHDPPARRRGVQRLGRQDPRRRRSGLQPARLPHRERVAARHGDAAARRRRPG